ncbi:MAG: hypothetical protein KC503_15230 [Myxococcales bacterium]|nr:hypothetical protein [Myxococcales bacterium]
MAHIARRSWHPLALVFALVALCSARAARGDGLGAQRFAAARFVPHGVVLDATHVYWTEGDGTIWRKAKRGGSKQQLIQRGLFAIALRRSGKWLLFTSRQGIYRLGLRGGTPQLLVPMRDTVRLALHGQHIYFIRSKARALYSVRLDAPRAKPRVVARGRRLSNVAFGPARLYVADYYGGVVFSVRPDGTGRRTLTRAIRRPVDIAVHRRFVYICAERAGTVVRVPRRGGRVEVLARHLSNHEVMIVHAGRVYWRDWKGGAGRAKLWRLEPATRRLVAVATGLSSPARYALDAEHLYVANKGTNEILRLAQRP